MSRRRAALPEDIRVGMHEKRDPLSPPCRCRGGGAGGVEDVGAKPIWAE